MEVYPLSSSPSSSSFSPNIYKVPSTVLNALHSSSWLTPTTVLAGRVISSLILQVRKLRIGKTITQGPTASEWPWRIQARKFNYRYQALNQ